MKGWGGGPQGGGGWGQIEPPFPEKTTLKKPSLIRINDVSSRNNLPTKKDAVYVINLNDKNSRGANWISLFIDRNLAVYFDSFGIEYIPKEVLRKVRDKSINHNIFRIQDNESIMCGFYCITFMEYMLYRVYDYTNLFPPNEYEKNDKVI